MSEFVYKDYLPANARVIVDYSKKQKVGFSYPLEWTYWKAIWKRGFQTVMTFWLALHLFLVYYLMPLFIVIFIGGTIFLIIHPIGMITEASVQSSNIIVYTFVGATVWPFAIPALITYWLALDKERMSKWFPKLGYWSAVMVTGTREKIFTKKDISDNKAIIPSFENIFLGYKTSGDFNEYLEKVEILEIPFSFKMRRFWLPFLSKKEKNDYDFRAVFYFSQTPKEGSLDVEFI